MVKRIDMKVALVHDYLREYGGAERVLEALHEIWPEAPVYTAFVDLEKMGEFGKHFKSWDIRPSWAQKFAIIKNNSSPFAFLTPFIWESFNFKDFDLVISSASWYITKSIITPPSAVHICYCHTPPRYLWGYPTANRLTKYQPFKAGAFLTAHCLRQYDYLAAQRVDYFIANSENVKKRIEKFYRREAVVIYPPVNVILGKNAINRVSTRDKGDYYLLVSRLSKEKGIDYTIKAFNELKLPLKIVGAGNQEKELKKMTGKTVEMLGQVNDEELKNLYINARALIFPALEEDFGIVPVEAMGYGLPVIALAQGGVLETVVEGKTGVFYDAPTQESLIGAINKFETMSFNRENIYKYALKFSKERFKKEMIEFVKKIKIKS